MEEYLFSIINLQIIEFDDYFGWWKLNSYFNLVMCILLLICIKRTIYDTILNKNQCKKSHQKKLVLVCFLF